MLAYKKKFKYKDLFINIEIEEDKSLVYSRTSMCGCDYPDDVKKSDMWMWWRYTGKVKITDKDGNPCNGEDWRSILWIYDDGSKNSESFIGIGDYIGEFMQTELIEIPEKIRLYKTNGTKVEFNLN